MNNIIAMAIILRQLAGKVRGGVMNIINRYHNYCPLPLASASISAARGQAAGVL